MRVFLTGATGFIGSAIIPLLKGAGHEVLGLARSDEGARMLEGLGAATHRGELTDRESLTAGARACEAVIHCAFIHDFTRFAENIEIDRRAVEAMIGVLEGSGKGFILTSGVAMVAGGEKRAATEADPAPAFGRGATEHVVLDACARDVRGAVVRLPQVHGNGRAGLISPAIVIAREKGLSAYIGEGANRWPAAPRLDVARLYHLALEKAEAGAVLHAVAEEGVAMRPIAEAIGAGLAVPVRSLTAEEAGEHFGWMTMFAGMDNPASSAETRRRFGWTPTGPHLLSELKKPEYYG